MVGELLPVASGHRRGATGLHAAATHRLHKVTHIEFLPNGVGVVRLATRVQCMSAFLHYLGRQRNITRYHQIVFLRATH